MTAFAFSQNIKKQLNTTNFESRIRNQVNLLLGLKLESANCSYKYLYNEK